MTCPLRIVLPSKGEMEAPTLSFLAAAGLPVSRPNPRQYQATMPAVPNAAVVFQRVDDVVNQVADGSADLGIAGLNNVRESQRGRESLIVVIEDLGYSTCELVLAVPDTWIDVATIGDLADVAVEFRERGRDLRIATKYRHLTSEFLLRNGITQFTLVDSQGAMEAAPNVGNADLIADLTSSGTTLRENHLKTIVGGTILRSQACLIANRETVGACRDRLAGVRKILELIEARRRAAGFLRITANICGESEEQVAAQIWARPELAGLAGPTVSRVYGQGPDRWYAVAIVVRDDVLLDAVEHLRAVGGSGVTVLPATYVFENRSLHFERLLEALGISHAVPAGTAQ
jgi:ATP phosphoribosyltransferase